MGHCHGTHCNIALMGRRRDRDDRERDRDERGRDDRDRDDRDHDDRDRDDRPVFWNKDAKDQRIKERDRRERLKRERAEREHEQKEDEALQESIKRRLTEGDLRERVVARVLELLRTDEVEAQVAAAAKEAVTTRRAQLLGEVAAEREALISEARRKEEERLSEMRRLKDIVRENERKVAAEVQTAWIEHMRAIRSAGSLPHVLRSTSVLRRSVARTRTGNGIGSASKSCRESLWSVSDHWTRSELRALCRQGLCTRDTGNRTLMGGSQRCTYRGCCGR